MGVGWGMKLHFAEIQRYPRLHSGLRRGLQGLFGMDLFWHAQCCVTLTTSPFCSCFSRYSFLLY